MPIHNLGYREWHGERLSGRSRWSVIAGVGIQRAWQSQWLRRIAFVVWAPPLVYGILVFGLERALSSPELLRDRGFQNVLRMLLPGEITPGLEYLFVAVSRVTGDKLITVVRPLLWRQVLLQLQRSQTVAMVIVIGLVAPPLISQDVRSRAFLLYFSRPLTRLQYIAGKFATVGAFLLLTCTLPQLLLYFFAVLLSPDVSVVAYTWDLPLRVVAASAMIIVPATMLALMLSSLTTETRFATFGWFAFWIFGLAAYIVVARISQNDTSGIALRLGFLFLLFSDLSMWVMGTTTQIRSLPQALRSAAQEGESIMPPAADQLMAEFPTLTPYADVQLAFAAALTVICFLVVFRRVSRPIQA